MPAISPGNSTCGRSRFAPHHVPLTGRPLKTNARVRYRRVREAPHAVGLQTSMHGGQISFWLPAAGPLRLDAAEEMMRRDWRQRRLVCDSAQTAFELFKATMPQFRGQTKGEPWE